MQQSLTSIVKATNGEVDSFLSATQMWFDRQMDRVTGSYKRWAKRWVLVLAVAVVCLGNIDSIAIARALYAGGATRATVIQQVTDLDFCSTPGDPDTGAPRKPRTSFRRASYRWAGRRPIHKMDLGLAAEGHWPAALGRGRHVGRALLVSLARSDRLTA